MAIEINWRRVESESVSETAEIDAKEWQKERFAQI